jgi:transposase
MPKSISIKKRWEIIFFHVKEEGPKLSISKTSRKLKISRWTVSHWVDVFNKTGDVIDKKSPGRPRKISHTIDKKIEKFFSSFPQITPKQVALELKSTGINISPSTVSRRIKEKGFKYCNTIPKPSLSKKQKDARLLFARQNITRNWNKVIFTDESTINLNPRIHKIWRKRTDKIFLRRSKYSKKINIWGCFSAKGFGKIILFTENLTARKMIEIYKLGLIPSFPDIGKNNWILLEDNDPKHRAKITNEYRKRKKIDRLSWPSNSPDLNPIENVWNYLKNKVAKYHPSNLIQLKSTIRKVWYNLPEEMARNLVLSMTNRLKQVIKARGDVIDY